MAIRRVGLILALLSLGCSNPPPAGKDAGINTVGQDAAALALYEITTLDPNATGDYAISLSVRGNKIAVAYWVDADASIAAPVNRDAGGETVTESAHELRYVEKSGTGAPSAPEVVATTYNVYGGSMALDSTGKPYVAFLGPPSNAGTKWLEACTVVATHSAPGAAWTQTVAATVFDQVVGLWASIAFDSNDKMYVGYRNIHYGQFPIQDYAHSNLEMAEGSPSALTAQNCLVAADRGKCPFFGGDNPDGHGAFLSIAMVGTAPNQEPAFAWSTMAAGALDTAHNVWFAQRKNGSWPATVLPISVPSGVVGGVSTGTGMYGTSYGGPQLAWDKDAGFIIAFDAHNVGQLFLKESPDGVDWSKAADPVFGSGSGGWYPSVAFTPDGFPAVAFYICDPSRTGVTTCPTAVDEIRLTWRVDDNWQQHQETVDPEGGHYMRLAYLSDGRAVIAYRDVNHRSIKVAVRK